MDVFAVEAFAASWIEIILYHDLLYFVKHVEAFAASWIEIIVRCFVCTTHLSKPLRLRGLKSYLIKADLPVTASKPLRLRGLKSQMKLTSPTRTEGRSLCGFVD